MRGPTLRPIGEKRELEGHKTGVQAGPQWKAIYMLSVEKDSDRSQIAPYSLLYTRHIQSRTGESGGHRQGPQKAKMLVVETLLWNYVVRYNYRSQVRTQ